MHDGQYPMSLGYVETLYRSFLQDADSVSGEWRSYFTKQASVLRAQAGAPPESGAVGTAAPDVRADGDTTRDDLRLARLQERVDLLIRNYRARGHITAQD